MIVQVLIGDPGFDNRIPEILVDAENSIHPLEDHDDGAFLRRRVAPSPVPAGAVRPNRHTTPIGESDYLTDFLSRARIDKGKGRNGARDRVTSSQLDLRWRGDNMLCPQDSASVFQELPTIGFDSEILLW